jgi:hypothetical protein
MRHALRFRKIHCPAGLIRRQKLLLRRQLDWRVHREYQKPSRHLHGGLGLGKDAGRSTPALGYSRVSLSNVHEIFNTKTTQQ